MSTANAGTTIYTFTPDAGQCASIATLSITVDPTISTTFNAVANVCQNSTAPVLPTSSTNVPPITGAWNAPVSTANAGTTIYTFTPDAGQCASTTTLSITVNAPVVPTFTGIGPLCLNVAAPILSLSSTNSSPITGTWSSAVVNTSAVGITTYTFTPDAGQCATTATMDIEITNSITPTFAAFGPFCQNSPTVLLPQSSSNVPSIAGTWTPFLSVNTSTIGTSTYTFTPDAGQCASLTTVDIVIAAPSITPTFNQFGPLCLNAVAPTLSLVSNNATPITGGWSPNIINTSVAGISTYTFTPDAGQCATTATMDIEITTVIVPTFASIGPLCVGNIAPSLPLSSTNTIAITGLWSPSTINTTSIGTFTFNFTADANQCAANTSINIDVTNSITPTFAAIAPLCQGAVAPTLPLSSTNIPAITGTWNPTTINTTTTGIVTYTFTPDAGQCGATVTLDVEVISVPPAPAIAIAASSTTICAGQSIDFTAIPNSTNTGDIIQWFINGNLVVGGTGLLFSSNTLNNNDQVTAMFTPSSSCLTGQTATSNLVIITVNPSVVPSISINATSTQICVGNNITFNTTISGGGSNPQVQWFINGNSVAGATAATFSSTTLSNNDLVSAQLISNAPCATPSILLSNSLSISILPYGTPTITITSDNNVICVGQQVVINAAFEFGGASPQFNWQVGGSIITTVTPSFTAIGLSASASVTCTLISDYACLTSPNAISNNIDIQVNPVPTVVLSENVTIQEGESTTLTATATPGMTYLWTPSESLSCNDCLLPNASPVETTVYTFSVIDPATTCGASDSLVVTVIKNYDIWVPTAFSPNGDSNNDFFFVRGNNVKEFTIRIFDKWGAQLYESANLAEGWNGEFKNKKINTGVLVYILDFTLNDGTAGSRKGNITVSN